MGQLAKQIADNSSNSFVANTENNPKEEYKAVMTRSKRFMEVEHEHSVVVPKKKAAEKKSIDDKKDDVRGEGNQEKEKQIMVKKKKLNDQEKEKELENRIFFSHRFQISLHLSFFF